MNESDNTMKKVCIVLGAVVVILLLAISFLLGKQSAAKKTDGAGRGTSEAVVTNAPAALPDAETDGGAETDAEISAADTTVPGETTQADAPAVQPATTLPPASSVDGPRTLEIEMSNGSLTFARGARFDVSYDSSVIRVSRSGDAMVIENDHSNPSAAERKRMDVVVTVPDGYAFEDVSVEMGAGKLTTQALRTDRLTLELGAGSTALEGLFVTGSADIRSGAGAFAVKSGTVNDLTLQCGAGATQVKAALTGDSRIVAAVGAVDLQFEGRESDYTVTFNMSLGACYYNDTKIARSGSFGSGPNRVDITGGFGVIRVNVG